MKKFTKKIKKPFKVLKKLRFQLLEVMVAIFILLLCAAPAIHIYTNTFMNQQKMIRENQRDHLVHHIHAYVTEQLYKKAIPFQQLLENTEIAVEDSELKAALSKIGYEGFYCFSNIRKKKARGENSKPTKYLVTLTIRLNDLLPTKNTMVSTNEDKHKALYIYKIYIDASENVNLNHAMHNKNTISPTVQEDKVEEEEVDI